MNILLGMPESVGLGQSDVKLVDSFHPIGGTVAILDVGGRKRNLSPVTFTSR